MNKRQSAVQERIASGILDAAAAVLAERGEGASMTEIAEAAGVGRATLYRHFPTRDELLRGLYEAAFKDIRERIADAELATVDVRKGIARLSRLFVTAATKYIALNMSGRDDCDDGEVNLHVTRPVRALLNRGITDGTFRGDLSPDVLFVMLMGLTDQGVQLVLRKELGVEQASDAVITVFLNGTTNPDHPQA